MTRDPGFYWLRDRKHPDGPVNPTVAHFDGRGWEFIGSLNFICEDGPEDALDGQRFDERFTVLGKVDLPAAVPVNQGTGRVSDCDCPVHHRHDCDQRPRIPTHVFVRHKRFGWCRHCGYSENEPLKHHPAPAA